MPSCAADWRSLAQALAFRGFTWLWGPPLYRRNRVIFRPFVLQRFATFQYAGTFRWEPIRWKEHSDVLEPWFSEVDRANDFELFRKLYAWKHQAASGRVDEKKWRQEVLRRFRSAKVRHERDAELAKLDLWQLLDEQSALELYRLDAAASRSFILKHSSNRWGDERGLWPQLFAESRKAGDDEFAFSLYRRQVAQKQWDIGCTAACRGNQGPLAAQRGARAATPRRLEPETRAYVLQARRETWPRCVALRHEASAQRVSFVVGRARRLQRPGEAVRATRLVGPVGNAGQNCAETR